MQSLDDAVDRLMRHPAFGAVAHGLACGFVAVHQHAPRTAALFATQQRWLMSHAALAGYFRGLPQGRPGLAARDFIEAALAHELCSRNTAAAFFAEALQYGIIEPIEAGDDRAGPKAAPSRGAIEALTAWYVVHLRALDQVIGGDRADRFLADAASGIAALEPAVAEGLLSAELVRNPGPVYTIFTWMDEGGILMDRLVSGTDPDAPDDDRVPTNVASANALIAGSNLSRTHAGRKLAAAEAIGALGWSGYRGRSPIWIARSFRDEYKRNQAIKLAIIERALAAHPL